MIEVRPAAVAGAFYPSDARQLAGDIGRYLAHATEAPSSIQGAPKALIVPHAGYIYSGPVAACAYALLRPLRETVRRVVLLGPAHRVAVQGLAVPTSNAFATPLGVVPIDHEVVDAALRLPQVTKSASAHALEHSIEVQLPFLQQVLGQFTLVPFAVGFASDKDVAEVLELLWGGDETLIVISSDLSHYHQYAEAQRIDRFTASNVLSFSRLEDHGQACGATPINGLLLQAKRHGLTPTLLDLRNSGDAAGDKSRVVGYASFAFSHGSDAKQ
jgi:hypothetical protein